MAALVEHGEDVLATRIDAEQAAGLSATFPHGRYNAVARTFRVPKQGAPKRPSTQAGWVAVISAGTSDLPWPRRPARRSIGWASA